MWTCIGEEWRMSGSLTSSTQIHKSFSTLISLMKFTLWVLNPTCLLWVKHECLKTNIFNIVLSRRSLLNPSSNHVPHLKRPVVLFPWKLALWRCCLMAIFWGFSGDGQTKTIHVQKAGCSFGRLRERGNEGIAMEEAWRGLWGFNEAIGEIRNRRWETRRAQSAAVRDFTALLQFVSAFCL